MDVRLVSPTRQYAETQAGRDTLAKITGDRRARAMGEGWKEDPSSPSSATEPGREPRDGAHSPIEYNYYCAVENFAVLPAKARISFSALADTLPAAYEPAFS
jgi:hypothetical protein